LKNIGVGAQKNVIGRALAATLNLASAPLPPSEAHSLMFGNRASEHSGAVSYFLLISLTTQPGASLEHCHIFVLAHVLRRPIIVYGIKYLKSFRGETLGFARFQGIRFRLIQVRCRPLQCIWSSSGHLLFSLWQVKGHLRKRFPGLAFASPGVSNTRAACGPRCVLGIFV